MNNLPDMTEEAPDEDAIHHDGEACSCPQCETAAAKSRVDAVSDIEGRRNWQARTRHGRLISECCMAPETEVYPADYSICPKCREHCSFIREPL